MFPPQFSGGFLAPAPRSSSASSASSYSAGTNCTLISSIDTTFGWSATGKEEEKEKGKGGRGREREGEGEGEGEREREKRREGDEDSKKLRRREGVVKEAAEQ
jgi:hypothetical protein